ncbi:hypothetical protein J6590_011365 [Homalodisca vitripennis]|nr:hypothetical protein J6590_011365 [Homalodisca vitripennis]
MVPNKQLEVTPAAPRRQADTHPIRAQFKTSSEKRSEDNLKCKVGPGRKSVMKTNWATKGLKRPTYRFASLLLIQLATLPTCLA